MSKLRVHDLAGEFGVPAEDVISVLRAIDVPVRSHLTVLTEDQVARVRARWEREKRALKEKAAAPAAAPSRRRKGAAAASTPPAPPPIAEATGVRRRRRVEAAPESVVPDEAAVATEVAASDGAAVAEPPTIETVEEPDVVVEAAPPVVAPPVAAPPVVEPPPPPPPPPVARPAPPSPRPHAPPPAVQPPSQPRAPERPKPRPIAAGPARPRPVPGSAPFNAPRPVASATPQGSVGLPTRDKRGGPGGGAPPPSTQQPGRKKKGKRGATDMEEVQQTVFRTMSQMRGTVPAKKGVRRPEESREEMEAARQAEVERERKTVRVNEFITVSELADILKVPATQIVGFAFKNLGLMVTINQRLDFDQIELIAGEFGFQAVKEQEYAADVAEQLVVDTAEERVFRPPVVTIMGHVDHGKTSLLDYIRKANVVAGESGGITQHIGAYHVELPNGKHITFLDTPGHQAFTAMRARGAQVTDIVVLVVAANDSVMPQTVEAISHAKNAGVPLIVAINKIDLPDANPSRVSQDLLQHGVVLEQFGGQTLSTAISAKKGTNVSELLDQVLLQSEVLDLRANPNRRATGAVIEAQLDPGKGPVATILVQNGTLRVGDDFISGMYSGRVRALLDERGRQVKAAGPAVPVQVLGLTGVPMAGDQFLVVEDSLQAREIAQRRERLEREARSRRTSKAGVTLEDFMAQTEAGEKRTLRMVIKADQGGPAEALADALQQLSNNEVAVEVVHRGVGAVTESDILLARTAGAIIVGFHVRPDNNARAAAEREGVDIKLYRVIYDAVNDVKAALEGMLRPEEKEVIMGEAEVREIFKISRIGTIAGCHVRSGLMSRTGKVRVIRDGVEVYDGNFLSLRRFKDDVKEVKEGYECGIGIENFNDIKVGDVIECYKREEVARTLAGDGKRGA